MYSALKRAIHQSLGKIFREMITTTKKDKNFIGNWNGSFVGSECSLHQLSPYIGKMKSAMAGKLVTTFSNKGDTVYDPFAGCGTVALESWILSRQIIANDLNPYASTLSRGKLNPYLSEDSALSLIEQIGKEIEENQYATDLTKIPTWVKDFYHDDTLNEIIVWKNILTDRQEWFLFSCLLGILHHQRPGFLSYPSSHTVPYLRDKKFPKEEYPELYSYRALKPRLEKKVTRALKRVPQLDLGLNRLCYQNDAGSLIPDIKANAIITSPPYMRRLDYGRDNRLRLWLLGENEWKQLDEKVSPKEDNFLKSMHNCFQAWLEVLYKDGYCVLVLDNSYSKKYKMSLTEALIKIAVDEVGGYNHIVNFEDPIPNDRRVRRHHNGSNYEIIVVLKRTG